MKLFLLAGLMGCVALTGNAQSDGDDSSSVEGQVEALSQLGEAMAASAAAVRGTDSESLRQIAADYRSFSNNFSSIQSYLKNGSYEQARDSLQRWLQQTKNETVKKALTELIATLDTEQEEQVRKLTVEIDSLLEDASIAIVQAKTTKELEAISRSLQELQRGGLRGGSPASQDLHQKVSAAVQWIQRWQQVVSCEESGDWSGAVRAIGGVVNYRDGTADLIPPAELEARFARDLEKAMTEPKKSQRRMEITAILEKAIDSILADVKGPEDVSSALEKFRTIEGIPGNAAPNLGNILNQLRDIERFQEMYEAGAYRSVIAWRSSRGPSNQVPNPRLAAIRDAIEVKAFIAETDLKDLGQPAPGQDLANFLEESLRKAFDARDWPRLYRLLESRSFLSGPFISRDTSMLDGVKAMVAAQQLEKVGQYREAAGKYTECISEVGKFVPIEAAGDALDRLRKQQPGAFAPVPSAE